jgi:hypothetical protein
MNKHKALKKLPVFTENYASLLEAFFDDAHCGQKQYELKKQRYLLQLRVIGALAGRARLDA